jgi:YidC/Oxa1 family membrane protein insertase
MDKNSAIGFGLLMVLLVVWIVFKSPPEDKKPNDPKQKTEVVQDSVANNAIDTTKTINASVIDSNQTTEEVVVTQNAVLENDLLKISFTNQGAHPTAVELKNFQTYTSYENKVKQNLILFDGAQNNFDFEYQKNGITQNTKKKGFTQTISPDGKTIQYKNADGFEISYSLPDSSYLIDIVVNTGGMDKSKDLTLFWNGQSIHTEREKEAESRYAQVCYEGVEDGFDTYDITEKKTENFDSQQLKWVTFKRHFFNTTLIPVGDPFIKGEVTMAPTEEGDSSRISNFNAKLSLKPSDQMKFQYFAGPNDYELLKSYDNNMQEIVPLSYGIFGFIKYINKGLILPLFNWLSGLFSNMGVVIILLTFIIRLLMSPFTYKSYVSSAKMKALKPELDELKEQYKDDKQAFGVEQMKLYRTAGVNPLGGCLPALLQMPIFFALFSFFPHAIQLRQKSFAWANDLSSYDSIVKLPINIPMYGDHISLFTILFAVTSILLALYSMSNATMDQSNPVMKYMPFIMPIMFLGIFNKFAAALTLYYFVSNLITLGLQVIIRKFIIDPDKIRAKILAKKNEPPKESKFMKKMKEMQEKQAEQAQTRSQRRK